MQLLEAFASYYAMVKINLIQSIKSFLFWCWEFNPSTLLLSYTSSPCIIFLLPFLPLPSFFFFLLFLPGSHHVAQAGLKLKIILLPQPPQCWDYKAWATTPSLEIVFLATNWKIGGFHTDSILSRVAGTRALWDF
jgi:hypothetical protein